MSQRWEEDENFWSSNNHTKWPRGWGQELGEAQSSCGFVVTRVRGWWVSLRSAFFILLPIFFDSHGFSLFSNVFCSKRYGHEAEQLELGQKVWEATTELCTALVAVIFVNMGVYVIIKEPFKERNETTRLHVFSENGIYWKTKMWRLYLYDAWADQRSIVSRC